MGPTRGKQVVLTAPLTESIDHAGFFIQMSLASIPGWMEWVIDKKYPMWRDVPRHEDGSAGTAPAGLRVVEDVLAREFGADNVVVCYPDDLEKFLGPDTRVVGISTHNPLGTTFAAGVYASIFGSSKEPVNSIYARKMFKIIKEHPNRENFKVILGGSGAWQIDETDTHEEFGIDCVVNGRAESAGTINLFRQAVDGEPIPKRIEPHHPSRIDEMIIPTTRTSFGVIEMTTGCGRKCSFCLPDLNPRISFPKDGILKAVEANVAAGNKQVSLATEDMFVWQTDEGGLPFFVPNRDELLDLYRSIVAVPGVEYVTLSHATMAPALVDPELIAELSEILLDKSPIKLGAVSTHPEGRALAPLIGIETGSVRIAKKIMAGKALPFDVKHWPDVVLEGLAVLNKNNWFPVCTLIVGSPDETDEDSMATLDMLYEAERRGLYCMWVPSIFTPLLKTRMEKADGIRETQQLSKLQWQVIMKAWRLASSIGLQSTWGKVSFGLGSLVVWATRLRRVNGPNFTWPLVQFSKTVPESWLHKSGRLYGGTPLPNVSRDELIASIRPDWLAKMEMAKSGVLVGAAVQPQEVVTSQQA
ncbi:MAG: B12-binding domain-containing radical SAM protein [Blastocatellia bacterium]|nr:B12-binding domain-containing radical SAM protein [Blastocatellia bacterium]